MSQWICPRCQASDCMCFGEAAMTLNDGTLHAWRVSRLLAASQHLPTELRLLKDITEFDQMWDSWPWQPDLSLRGFVEHMKRAMTADTSQPLLIGEIGNVLDGMHRICSAEADGITELPVRQFEKDPTPDVIVAPWGEVRRRSVIYNGFELLAWREQAAGGWESLYFYSMRLSDGWFLEDSFTTGDDLVDEYIGHLREQVNDFLENPEDYEQPDDYDRKGAK